MSILKSVCIKEKRTNKIKNIKQADLIKTGIPNDIHCTGGDFQISILSEDFAKEYCEKNNKEYFYGEFGENFSVENFDISKLKVGDKLRVGDSRLEITQIGANKSKNCKNEIHDNFVFAKVLHDGIVTEGDELYIE